jgi:threonine/homoserine/homoserine lactone efflux protein
MPYLVSLLTLSVVYLAVLASPGPNFFLLSQLSLSGRQREARWTVFGLATGSIAWVVLALAGLSALFATHVMLGEFVRLLGAAYLVWYGAGLLWSALRPQRQSRDGQSDVGAPTSPLAAYRVGLVTGLTNPKGAAFWTSAFATLLPHAAPTWFLAMVVVLVALFSLGWHLGITLVFGLDSLRSRYLRFERGINGIAGGALILLGLQRLSSR